MPHDNWQVHQYVDGQGWLNVTASLICHDTQKELYPNETTTDCNLYVNQTTLPGQISFTQLIYDENSHLSNCTNNKDYVIENS